MKIENKQTSRSRGRPRTFDEDVALDRAMRLFWERGYETTSMAELIEAMGVSAPSIYSTFGDKKALFMKAIERYRSSVGLYTARIFEEEKSTKAAIARLLGEAADGMAADSTPTGCMLALSTVNCAAESTEIQEALRGFRKITQHALQKRIEQGINHGDMPAHPNAKELAGFITTYLYGMSMQARDGVPAAEMHTAARIALDSIIDTEVPLPAAKR